MINILKLRQLEKEKKQQAVPDEKGNESIPENAAAYAGLTENEMAVEKEPEKPKKKSGKGQTKKAAAASRKKSGPDKEITVVDAPAAEKVLQENVEVSIYEPAAAADVDETAELTEEQTSGNKETEVDPAELFRQNLIAQVLQDESMISREEYLKEIGAVNPEEAEAESAPEIAAIQQESEPPAAADRVPAAPVINNTVKVPEPEPEIKREVYTEKRTPEVPAPTGIRKSSEYEKNDELKNKKVKESIIQMVGFTIGNEYYGVDICKIKEINRMTEITKVPRAPEFIEGVINLRGTVIPVINLRTKVRMPKKAYDKDTRIIIVELSGRTIGFIVDGVREVLRIPDTLLDPPPALAVGKRADYITHVAKLEDDLVILMDPEKVLSNDELGRIK